jgi:hypothetical protein
MRASVSMNVDHVAHGAAGRRTDGPGRSRRRSCAKPRRHGITTAPARIAAHAGRRPDRLSASVRPCSTSSWPWRPEIVAWSAASSRTEHFRPERREEITTEGGLDLSRATSASPRPVTGSGRGRRVSSSANTSIRARRARCAGHGLHRPLLHTWRGGRRPRGPSRCLATPGLGLAAHMVTISS